MLNQVLLKSIFEEGESVLLSYLFRLFVIRLPFNFKELLDVLEDSFFKGPFLPSNHLFPLFDNLFKVVVHSHGS